MSLGPHFVKCVDGKWYEDLTYRAADNTWFICFDESDPPELVMRKTCKLTVTEILNQVGIVVSGIKQGNYGSDRIFGRRFCAAKSYWLEMDLNKPLPAPRAQDTFDSFFTARTRREGTYFGEAA